ncbi:MAG: DsrE-related protein SaoD [Actinomycetota bacterium]|nr:MAG: hypothetical protein FD171_1998 [Actinomycetota bacterium]MDO8950007.1 DsrE-related protein SaoD [Actinomycetota bacterium]MDP3630200.1 DsrE-related protein SaoD [Actinomycetota bacterium]
MKVAYVFATTTSQKILDTMIIPQMEEGRHGVDVLGMFFFVDNTFFLLDGTETGRKLQALQEKTGMLLMACDQCAYERHIADKLIPGAGIGCFPDLYAALGPAAPDQVITL